MIPRRKLFFVALVFTTCAASSVNAAGNVENGKALYATLCASCHGGTGAGDGPIALSLPPSMKPRNLQSGQFKFATDDEKFTELLRKGGAAVGLNPLMPAQSTADNQQLDDLIAFVHSLRK